jgi:hypothetical protein
MDSRHALDGADAGAFGKSRDYRDLLIGIEDVRHTLS